MREISARLICAAAALCMVVAVASHPKSSSGPPHIIFIMADDLGWNDVGFHGSNQIPTPNIDALAYSGVILNQYYVTAICTPSRSALMTGKHPIHTGMQHTVLFGAEPRGLPLSEKLLPEYLKDLGYDTHIVGKWHLGCYRKEYTPLYRGFDSHLGYWTGHHDYNDHTAVESPYWGLDMRRGMEPAWDLHGQYSTDVFTNEAVRLIRAQNSSQPLFLYLAHAAVHSANPYNPLCAPDDIVAKYPYIENYNRRRFAAVLQKLDESVGKVIEALEQNGMLQNSIIVFTTDNGGPAAGFNINAASNWPLRGVKNTLWEGGVRGAGLIWSPLITKPNRVATQLFHITDWLPTLYSAAGGNPRILPEDIDGYDLWTALKEDLPSNRTYVLHNIDDLYGNAALTIGEWKIVKGTTYNGNWDGWYGPSGRDNKTGYNIYQVLGSPAGRALGRAGHLITRNIIYTMRSDSEVLCDTKSKFPTSECNPLKSPCLFNIKSDPCERFNLASVYPAVLAHLEQSLAEFNATAVPPSNLPWDPRGDPRFWDHTWANFGDHSVFSNALS